MPGAACVFLQVETDLGQVGWQPQPQKSTLGERHRKGLPVPSPTLPGLGVEEGVGEGRGAGCGPVGTLASPGPGPSQLYGNSILWRTPTECLG